MTLFQKSSRKNKSIQRTLVNSISLLFGLCCFIVYLVVDVGVDNWADTQFDKNVTNHANYLKSLISVNDDQVKFDVDDANDYASYGDEFYYQLWFKDQSIYRSESLNNYPDYHLTQIDMPLNTKQLLDLQLPDGENGRAVLMYFLPNQEMLDEDHEHPIYLAFYASDDSLDYQLLLLDGLLVGSLILSLFFMRYVAIRIVSNGLKPLQSLNQKLNKFDIEQDMSVTSRSFIELDKDEATVEEIEPIRNEINAFIKENQTFIQNEKRLTGDIAHELKTPIAELISLSEVSIRYPDDERINKTYKEDMLKIGQRMQDIVENLLLLHRTSSHSWHLNLDEINLDQLISQLLNDLSFEYADIHQRVLVNLSVKEVNADKFSLMTILSNLLGNALYYGDKNKPITLSFEGARLSVHNFVETPLTEQDKKEILKPLYQADTSRTSDNHHGLGLSIVNNICHKNHYEIEIQTPSSNTITPSHAVQFVITGI